MGIFNREIRFAAVGLDGFVRAYDRSVHSIPQSGRVPYDWRSPADVVAEYEHTDFFHLTTALECLKTDDPDESVWHAAEEIARGFLAPPEHGRPVGLHRAA